VIDGNAGHGIAVTQNSGGNLSDGDEDSALLAQPNSGSNARFGIRCNVGAYITGSRGGLTGASGAVKADQGCVDVTLP
jgi:hypothetical protein